MIQFLTLITLSLYVHSPIPHALQTPLAGINTWRFNCSMVMVSPTEALTAAHCTEKEPIEYEVKTYEGQIYTAELVYIDKDKDLALFKIGTTLPTYAKLGRDVVRGDKVLIMSSEDNMPGTYGEGMVQNIILDPETECPQIVHTIPILGGASGSGLFNDRGELVGINVSRQAATSYATETLQIRHFLEDHYQFVSLRH